VEQARFAYDALGRRLEKTAAGVAASYTYDGQDVIRKREGTTRLDYVFATGIDEAISADDQASASYFHTDGLGSVVRVSDGLGGVTLNRQYDAWGKLAIGASESGYAFTGREWDPETSLYYYRARYYDASLGRFVSEDPVRFYGGANFFAYVGNHPTDLTDPYGLQSVPISCMQTSADEAAHLAGQYGWGYAHCYASCQIKKRCSAQFGAAAGTAMSMAGGALKEHYDMGACLVKGDQGRCDSAYQPSDYDDNRRGYTCPANQDCATRCEALKNSMNPPGPFWWVGCFRGMRCDPWVMTFYPRTAQP
jgi:RHS repeat-associated protein